MGQRCSSRKLNPNENDDLEASASVSPSTPSEPSPPPTATPRPLILHSSKPRSSRKPPPAPLPLPINDPAFGKTVVLPTPTDPCIEPHKSLTPPPPPQPPQPFPPPMEKVYEFTAADFAMTNNVSVGRPVKSLPKSSLTSAAAKRRRGDDGGSNVSAATTLVSTAGNGNHHHPGYSTNTTPGSAATTNTNTTVSGFMTVPSPVFVFGKSNRYAQSAATTATMTTTSAAVPISPAANLDNNDDDRERERDQQGNTKKRKVPAAAQHHFRNVSSGSGSGEGDDVSEGGLVRSVPGGVGEDGAGRDDVARERPVPATSLLTGDEHVATTTLKRRLPEATDVNMRTKDVVRKRRRLMSSVLGSASNGSTHEATVLAIDCALADPTLDWHLRGPSQDAQTQQKPLVDSRSREKRKKKPPTLSTTSQKTRRRSKLPSLAKFGFNMPHPAGERLKILTEEIAIWKTKFQTELAKLAKAKRMAEIAPPADSKRPGGARKKVASGPSNGTANAQKTPPNASPGPATPNPVASAIAATAGTAKKGKKKGGNKTADPHRTGNYIPSRLPTAAGLPTLTPAQAAASVANLVSPLPVRFLAADVAPKHAPVVSVTSSLPPVQPEVEWICPFCDWDLFFGEEGAWRRAIRARKKLLKRRRRARERAAAAASGVKAPGRRRDDRDAADEDEDPLNQDAQWEDPKVVEERLNAAARLIIGDEAVEELKRTHGIGARTANAIANGDTGA